MGRKPINALIVTALLATLTVKSQSCQSAELKQQTVRAFDQYIHDAETTMDHDLARRVDFLWIDGLSGSSRSTSLSELESGQVVVQASGGQETTLGTAVPGGLIHDWTGIVFVPRVSIAQALALLQDYDRDQNYYAPEVVKSKTLERDGNKFRVFLRLKRTNVITAVFNTEYSVQYFALDDSHAYSRSYSTRIAEVENPDTFHERELTVGNDHGFVWRLYSYWRFYQSDRGTFIQCRAISLSRNVPTGLSWIVKPFIEGIPVESLRFTLKATRRALLAMHP